MAWIEQLLGIELGLAARFVIAFLLVLVLIAGAAWAIRRFAGRPEFENGGRGRQPRLGVLEALAVDQRRRLVLVRRDNMEHLILIGGPADLVVEANIMRGAPAYASREEAMRAAQRRQQAAQQPRPQPQAGAPPEAGSPSERAPQRAALAPPPAAPASPENPPQPPSTASAPRSRTAPPAGSAPEKPAPPPVADRPAAADRPARAASERPEGREPVRPEKAESGFAGAASALEQALRRPFGGGRVSGSTSADGADPQRARSEARGKGDTELTVTPLIKPVEKIRSEPDAGRSQEAPQATGPQRSPTSAESRPSPGPGPREPSGAAQAGQRPAPFSNVAGFRPPAPPAEKAPGPAQSRPSDSPRPAASARDAGKEAQRPAESGRTDHPASVSIEDEMANLLDEIAGSRERK